MNTGVNLVLRNVDSSKKAEHTINVENTGHWVREFGRIESCKCPFLNLTLLIWVKALWFWFLFLHLVLCFSLVCLSSLFSASLSCLCLCSCCPAKETNKLPKHVVIPHNPIFPTFPNTNLSGSGLRNQPLQRDWPIMVARREKVGDFTVTEVLVTEIQDYVSMTIFLLHSTVIYPNTPGKSGNPKLSENEPSEKTCSIQLCLNVRGLLNIINIIC